MIKLFGMTFAVATSILMVGCVSIGKDFREENVSQLDLGSLKRGEETKLFGTLPSRWATNTPSGRFEGCRYLFAHGNLATARSRLLDLEFKDGLLHSYLYASMFRSDATAISESAAHNLMKGQSQAEVLRLLGKPSGKSLYPSHQPDYKGCWEEIGPGSELWAWCYAPPMVTFGSHRTEFKTLFVSFDAEKKLLRAIQKESGNKLKQTPAE